ncbi:DUF3617 domain-containing protein [Shewanella sp.]|uniref:DUF3617 domain-containing protein n=1 Tax=Shewanella sp. TaxID=50422 RepID=UPI003A987CBF
MQHSVHKLLLTGLIFTSPLLYAEDYDFTPGLWEITTKSEGTLIKATPEMKQMLEKSGSLKPFTYTKKACIRKFNLFDDANSEDGEKCQKNIQRINATQATFESNCTSIDSTTHTVGEYHLNGKTLTFTQESEVTEESMSIKGTLIGNGKYLGPCK